MPFCEGRPSFWLWQPLSLANVSIPACRRPHFIVRPHSPFAVSTASSFLAEHSLVVFLFSSYFLVRSFVNERIVSYILRLWISMWFDCFFFFKINYRHDDDTQSCGAHSAALVGNQRKTAEKTVQFRLLCMQRFICDSFRFIFNYYVWFVSSFPCGLWSASHECANALTKRWNVDGLFSFHSRIFAQL